MPASPTYLVSPNSQRLNDVFAENVKAILAARKWSFERLSEESGVPLRTIQQNLRRTTTFSLTAAHWIALSLNTTVDALCNHTEQFYVERGGQTALQCTHTERHLLNYRGENTGVCPQCLGTHVLLQDRKNLEWERARPDVEKRSVY